jgi:sRNA-binding regulator protein Hfq
LHIGLHFLRRVLPHELAIDCACVARSGIGSSFPAQTAERDTPNRHAELFYLQKQIQSQTPMVIVLEDGERVDGCIEWYDRNSLKVRGRNKTLIYKSAIKYMYKLGDNG